MRANLQQSMHQQMLEEGGEEMAAALAGDIDRMTRKMERLSEEYASKRTMASAPAPAPADTDTSRRRASSRLRNDTSGLYSRAASVAGEEPPRRTPAPRPRSLPALEPEQKPACQRQRSVGRRGVQRAHQRPRRRQRRKRSAKRRSRSALQPTSRRSQKKSCRSARSPARWWSPPSVRLRMVSSCVTSYVRHLRVGIDSLRRPLTSDL